MLTIGRHIYLCIFIFCCITIAKATPEYYFKQISLKDGLSESMVKCVLMDHEGTIWIGTQFGLNCFDREHVKNYYHEEKDINSIPDNDICFLVEDSLQNLWIATARGLVLYNKEKDCFVPVDSGGSRLYVSSYVLMQDGLLFLGRNKFFKYSYSDKRISALRISTKENAKVLFEKAALFGPDDNRFLLASRWNGLWEYNIQTGNLQRSSLVKEY